MTRSIQDLLNGGYVGRARMMDPVVLGILFFSQTTNPYAGLVTEGRLEDVL